MGSVVSFFKSVGFAVTGHYWGDDGNNDIDAYGIGGVVKAYGGDDTIRVGAIGVKIYTGSGHDTVYGGAGYMSVIDDCGNLTVKGAAGYADISKSESGNVHFAGGSGGTTIDHLGRDGDIRYQGAALVTNLLTRKGGGGDISFEGAGGYNELWHETDRGDLSFKGAGAGNKIDRTWHSRYQGSKGNIHFSGAGAYNNISSRVESGNVTLNGAGAYNEVFRKGREGDINFNGAGGWNKLSRLRNDPEDLYQLTQGDIHFNGAGGYNRLLSDVDEGNIHFNGAGGYNNLSRKGSGSENSPFAGASADEIVLSTATMGGRWIKKSQLVTASKSTRYPNTYLFAIFDGTSTKVNRVELSNDIENGALRYISTSWFKGGNHLEGLASHRVDERNGFIPAPDGAYRLSDLVFERRQRIKRDAVEADLAENSWVNYGGGVNVAAADVTLSRAKMSGYAIFEDGTKVDVSAVKSLVQANTYVFAKQLGAYTKIVVVELANDKETGALKYLAKAWYKEGNHLAGLANEIISERTGFTAMGTGGYSLSEVHYQLDTVMAVSERLPATREFSSQLLRPYKESAKSKGDIFFDGAGAANVIESDVTEGSIHFNGAGAANVLIKRGLRGDLVFRGAGLVNVLVHQGAQGRMDAYAAGAANVLVRSGDGEYLACLLAFGNISVQQGRGNSKVIMLGGYNTHTHIGSGHGLWLAAGGFNVMTQVGQGDVASVLVGGVNVLTKVGDGGLISGMLGGANVITHISSDVEASNTTVVALGGANILTKKGKGNTFAVMGGGANVLTHVGDRTTTGMMVGGANILTKVGNGDTTGIMLGIGNVLTHVGDGQTLGVMGAAGNIFTKVGDGTSIAAMIGAGNILTHVGKGNAWALMGGVGNVFTKVGDGDALALMVAKANVFTHIGDGMSVAIMLAKGNVATKVGNGTTLAAMVGIANIFTHVGSGSTFAAMIGKANIMTKVGNDLTVALMVGKANIYTHVGDSSSIGLFAGTANIMTKVGNGTTLAAMFGKANIMTHVGKGLTGVLALGEANFVTKVGNSFMGVVAAAKANVVTHVGHATTAALLAGKGNILTKVGEGTTVGLLISDIGNVMTHIGDGTTIGIAKGKANIITKVGKGLGVNVAWGQANVLTHVGDGDRYNFAKGEANIITKVGDGQEVSVVQGKANIITHVGNGNDYTGAWGTANVITKVGNGRNVVMAKGDANIVTQVGDGDSFNALWSKGNIVTKVGDGMQVTAAKGQANITTTVGNGLSVTAAYGDANVNTKVGGGITVNVAWGKFNINTKVGDGLNVAVMKGKANANIHVGDGLDINASYAQNNVAIKVGNGDFYSLAVASSNTSSNKLSALFNNIKQTLLGVGGSQAINYLVQGDDATSSGTHKGRGAIATPEITKLDGFHIDSIKDVGTGLGDSLTGSVTEVDTPDLNMMQNTLNVDASSNPSQLASAVSVHATQNQASQNALSDKDRAEADRQRLEQEKQKQLDAVAGSQHQLESTDQQALKNNGQAQQDAVKEESEVVTGELTKLAQGLDALDSQAPQTSESSNQWCNDFAGGLLQGVQAQLDNANQVSGKHIAVVKQRQADNNRQVKVSVAQSEAAVVKGEQNRAGAEQDITDAKVDAEKRKADALVKRNDAKQSESNAHNATKDAKSRGEHDVKMAQDKANQAKTDAQGAKLSEDHRPDRQGAAGSGLSGEAHSVEGAGETDSHVNAESKTSADGRFSKGLTEQEQEALDGALNAVNRLQINAGIRGQNRGSTITAMFTETKTDSIVVPTTVSRDVRRNEVRISGVNLEALGEKSSHATESLVAARAEKVANLYRWLDSDNNMATDNYVPVPGFEHADASVSDEAKQSMIKFVGGYIERTENQVPKDQVQALATLFVEATLNYDWDKRVEFLSKLEIYGYSFEAPHGEKSIVSFWSGRNFKEYRKVLDNAQPDDKKIVYDIDVKGNAFAIELNKQLMRWGNLFLDSDNAEQNQLKSYLDTATFSNTGFWSSVYATSAQNDVYVIAEGGVRLGNYFWNVELPALRQLQREGLVGEIRLLDKPVSEYKNVLIDDIGCRLTDAGVAVKVRFDALSVAKKNELLALNKATYKADTLVGLEVNLSAIDSMLRDALPFYSLRTERNILVKEMAQEGDVGFEVRAWPGIDSKSKTIILDNPEDTTQQKAIERFILANFDNFEQMPDELFLVNNNIISHHEGRTRNVAQKVDGTWHYNAKVELMSVTELLDAAHVTGKIRGESYQQVIDALTEYHAHIVEHADYELGSVEKLVNLRKQIEGYVLGHPDSGRLGAMRSLLNQVNTRLEEVSVLTDAEQKIKAHDSFSRLYDQLENAHVKETKHLYLDGNGDFVTKGKGNLGNVDQLGGSEAVLKKVKSAVSSEYGQTVADTIFAGLSANDLAKDGKGIDIAGLNKVHQAIAQYLSPVGGGYNVTDAQPNIMKGGLLRNIGDKIFDRKAGSKELEMSSFHFSQGADLLDQLTTLIPEVGNVLITDGNDAQSKDFLEGVCFALSARYMMEERVHGPGGGKAYMEWLKDTVQAYTDNTTNKTTDIVSIEQKLLNQYRRQHLGLAVKDLLSMQYSQLMDTSTAVARDAANKEYGGKLKANGLTGPNINDALSYGADGYESVMDKLRNVKKSTYMTFMSQGHAMSVVVHKKGNQNVWSFYDPNFGAKSFAQYDDFRGFMDNFHKGVLTQYKFQESEEAGQSFYVKFNKFEEGEISNYDGLWKDARQGEQTYVLRALKELETTFKLNKQLTGKVIGVEDGSISFELTTKTGTQLVVEVEAEQFSEAAQLVQSNAKRLIEHLGSKKVTLHRNNFEDVIESALYDKKNGDNRSTFSEGKVQKKYQSRDLILAPILQPETIELGMPEIDQKILAEVAERENVIIGVRPVDEKSKSLIESKMYSSKGLFVKAKSSDWGPMSGFIPVDQSFAKASARRELEKFNGYAEQSIVAGNAVAADLYLNQTRIDELVSKYQSLTPLDLDAASGMYKTTATNGDQTVPFFLNKVTVDGKELWQVHYIKDGELAPFKVIGDPVSKQPMTADYDLLTVLHPYADLGPQDKVKLPLTWEQWKESVTYEDLTPNNKDLYNSEQLYNKRDGASLGIVSDRLKKLKDVINTSLGRTNGLEMVHHGADDANPYAVMADNFPATFFVPNHFFTEDGLGEGKGSIQTYFNVNEQGAVVIRNPQEFSNFQQIAINVSYRASQNDRWNIGLDEPLFTTKRKLSHEFINTRETLARKFSGEPNDLDKSSDLKGAVINYNEPSEGKREDVQRIPTEQDKVFKLTGANSQLEALGGEQGSKIVHTIDTLQPSEILDEVIRDLNKSSTVMSETNFYDPKRFESDSGRVKAEWKQTLTNINNIRNMYFPHDMARYFEALKSYKVGNCGDRALYAAHLIMDKYNFQGEVELLKLKGSGDHVFVRVGGTSDAAKIIDPWTGQHFSYSLIKTFLYNPKEKRVEVHRSFDELKTLFKDLHQTSLSSATKAHNSNVENWKRVAVTPQAEGGKTRFDGQMIVQMENDAAVAKAAANLAGKHPENSVVVQLDSDGNYRVVYGDPSKLDGKLRWQLVGHGRSGSENSNASLGGYSADELAVTLVKFQQAFNQAENISSKPDHVSIVGCSLVSDDKQKGFGHQFINALDANGLRVNVSVRSSAVAVDTAGRKHTQDAEGDWVQKAENNKVSLTWTEQGEVVAKNEHIRNGVAESDIDISRIGVSGVDEPVRGALGDNRDVFHAPEKRKMLTQTSSSSASNTQLSYSGNIQVNVGDGEFTAVNWGTSNVGIKVGTGGFKSLAFGDNNVMVHIGNGDSKHSFDIGGYQALEGAQMFIGNRNVSFNLGRSNDLIVMMDKSIPTPPLVNPFDGAARISGVLQSIVTSGKGQDWLAAQEQQWSLSGAKKFVKDMSGLDLSSSVDYTSLVELNSQHERSSRGLKHDAEATLNKQYNQWLSGNGNNDTSKLSRADKLRQANEKLAFNFAVGGQGADIQVTTGNWNFMFGDNIQSILDTNLGSLFGLMTQQFSATGQAKTTFTYTPQDLPRQLKNKLLGQLAGVGAETTLADIFGVDYSTSGHLVARNGEAVDGVAILKEMLEVIGEFSGDQLQAFVDPAKLLDSLKSGIDMGADGIKSFAETHGLKEKESEEKDGKASVSVSVNGASGKNAQSGDDTNTSNAAAAQERAFGFNALNLPNLFATIFSQGKQKEMVTLVENLKQNLTADLLNMKEKTFDFLRNSGHLQGDGDINLSLGNYNFNWGGDGKDLGAYLGDNNNFWGGRGDDVFYATGTSNIFTGGAGQDTGVMMGRENMMFGGQGDDVAVLAGRINRAFMGEGNDQAFIFGEGGIVEGGTGQDYLVTSGNYNQIDAGVGQDFTVTIGHNNQIQLGEGDDFAMVFGNNNRLLAEHGNNQVKLMGYHATIRGGDGRDQLSADQVAKFSQLDGCAGDDLLVLGGYQNQFRGGTGVDSFVFSGAVIENLVQDIGKDDFIVLNDISWRDLWFKRSGYDLELLVNRRTDGTSEQGKFEQLGRATFSNYFADNRAQLVIGLGEQQTNGERSYTALSHQAVDTLIQAMSTFAPEAGDMGLLNSLDNQANSMVYLAWSEVSNGRARVA
ncbi:MARTX multifunctional-autoprocessing repeats-in-toxin holotoxin RtxA [Aeromonas veronii]|uniref:MARTX multifunctional-autoprocessing repeats-in-toxin holotoxin RtxA n=1 Tax=Aeromonas veronii TaxID=654 RepID=UPI003B9ED101